MSETQENSRERAELCFSIHSYSLWEAELNLYPSVSSAASQKNKRDLWQKKKKKSEKSLQTLWRHFVSNVYIIEKTARANLPLLLFFFLPRSKQKPCGSNLSFFFLNLCFKTEWKRNVIMKHLANSSWLNIKFTGGCYGRKLMKAPDGRKDIGQQQQKQSNLNKLHAVDVHKAVAYMIVK